MSGILTQAVIALSILLVIWYVAGSWLNRRRALNLLRWVREGVQNLGGRATMRWLGRTSGFQVSVKGAKRPFKKIEMMVLLEPREVLLLWLFNRLRGRRDMMSFKADLRTRPKAELEIVPRKGRITKKILKAVEEGTWAKGKLEDTDLIVILKDGEVAPLVEKLTPLLRECAPHVLRLSLRKQSPHLLANLSLPGLEGMEAEAVFTLLEQVIRASQPS